MRYPLSVLWATILALFTIAVGSATAHGAPDVLDRPALMSTKASTSVLLAVTSAGKRIVAVGERGIILFSDDNGATWRQAKVPVSVTLTAVHFPIPRKGWAVGHSGIVIHTEDSGETWTRQLDGKQAAQLVFDAVQAKTRIVKGDSEALKKQLAAAKQLVDDGADKPFLDVFFRNERSGFIVGAFNLIFRTEDGGATWQPWQDHVDNPRGLHLYGIRQVGDELYLAGEQGAVLHSKNDGATFVPLKSSYAGTYFGLLGTNKGGILLYGLRGNAFWSVDRGASWRKADTGTSLSITAGRELNDGSLLLVSQAGEVLLSQDGGRSFRKVPVKDTSPLSGVAQASDGGLVLVGARGVSHISKPDTVADPSRKPTGGRI